MAGSAAAQARAYAQTLALAPFCARPLLRGDFASVSAPLSLLTELHAGPLTCEADWRAEWHSLSCSSLELPVLCIAREIQLIYVLCILHATRILKAVFGCELPLEIDPAMP